MMQPPQQSSPFQNFRREAPRFAEAFQAGSKALEEASALDPKTRQLAYLAVLAALGLEGGLRVHVKEAKTAGATREEVLSTLLVGLPAAGIRVMHAIGPALAAYDAPA